MKSLSARPAAGHDYAKELENRFYGRSASLLRMDYIGSTSEERRPYAIVNGVALIGITGVLSNDPCWWDETGYADIQNEVSMAANDSAVKGILLCVNSPGGDTENAFETATVLEGAGKLKPMWAVASPIAYSGGYLLASKGAKLYMPPVTGGVGSIGVYGMHFDYSEALKKAGVDVTIISAGEGKADGNRYQPLSPEAKARAGVEINRLYGEFVANVASGRKMGESAVVKLGAFLYEGAKAGIGAGLADRAGDASSALADLVASIAAAPLPAGSAASADSTKTTKKGVNTMEDTNAKPLTAEDLATIRAEATKKGASAVTEILALCMLADVPLAKATEYASSGKSVEEIRGLLLAAKAAHSGEQEIRNGAYPGTGADANFKPAKTIKQLAEAKLAAQKGAN